MANSGFFDTSSYNNRGLTFSWWVNSRNIEGNYTDIGWNLVGNGSKSGYYMSGDFNVWIAGENAYNSSTRIELWNGTVVASGTKRLYHDNDGNCYFEAYAEASIYSYAVNCSGSGGWSLDNIPRQATLTGANDFNDEANPYMTFNNAGGLPINARLEFAGVNIQRNDIPNTGNYTFNLSSSERDLLRSKCTSNSMTVRYVVGTKINGNETYWSWVDKTMTIVNGNPTFSDFTYKDTNTKVTAITGNDQVLVKGLSTLQATINSSNKMVANKKASAKNYVAIIDNINKSDDYSTSDLNIDLGAVTSSGTKRLNIRAYDSRNNSTLVYKDITVYDYDKPVINASVTRLNNFENQTTLKVSGTYSKLTINNTDKNKVKTLQYRYRESGGTWSSWKALTSTIADGKFSCSDVILSLDNTKAFDFEVQAVDNLETNTLSLKLDIGQAVFFISSNKKVCYINGQEILTKETLDSILNPVWKSLPLTSNWRDFNADFNSPSYCRKGNMVYLKGLIKRESNMVAGETIANLPVGYRPAKRVIISVLCGSVETQRIDIHTTGEIKTPNVVNSSDMLSLENIFFSTN